MSLKAQIYDAVLFASKQVGKKEKGHNAGPFVSRILASVGLGPGFPWCAAFVRWCLDSTGCKGVGPRKGAAAVRNWATWATEKQKHTSTPSKGDLFYWLNGNGTGHIGWVVDHWWSESGQSWMIHAIEGNTNDAGGREGDGAYRRTRKVTPNIKFIRLW